MEKKALEFINEHNIRVSRTNFNKFAKFLSYCDAVYAKNLYKKILNTLLANKQAQSELDAK
jgi:hypothetical protein